MAVTPYTPCLVYGIDFQPGGTYFQNTLSYDAFSFVQSFQNCSSDEAYNVLVDPSGKQYDCTDTSMVPANYPQLSSCPVSKSMLTTGNWSILVFSNNSGGQRPLAAQRNFQINAGPQITSTVTPVVTVTSTLNPVATSVWTETYSQTKTLRPDTSTLPAKTVYITQTIVPDVVQVPTTRILQTLTTFIPSLILSVSTIRTTMRCSVPVRQYADFQATITPTLPRDSQFATLVVRTLAPRRANWATIITPGWPNIQRTAIIPVEETILTNARDELAWTKALAQYEANRLYHRAVDFPTVTWTETNTALFSTITVTVTGKTFTSVTPTTTSSTRFVTPRVVTVPGNPIISQLYTTKPTPTITTTEFDYINTIVTTAFPVTIKITTQVTPPASIDRCKAIGGIFI